jgi:hypothetical protein
MTGMNSKDIRSFLTSPERQAQPKPFATPMRKRNRIIESDSSDHQNGGAAENGRVLIQTSSDDSDEIPALTTEPPATIPPNQTDQQPREPAVQISMQSPVARRPVNQTSTVEPPKPTPQRKPKTSAKKSRDNHHRRVAEEAEESDGHTSEFSCDESGESAREQYRSSILGVRSRPAALHQVRPSA